MKKINEEIIQAFLDCHYKAFLKFHDVVGSKTEYELLECNLLQRYKTNFFSRLDAKSHESQVLEKIEIKEDVQYTKLTYIISPTVQSLQYLINFDAIEISPPNNSTRIPSYIPIFISPDEKISATEKLLLCTKSLLLNDSHNIAPEYGKIVYGKKLKSTKFALKPYSLKAHKLLGEITKVVNNDDPPRFYRNTHCPVCEFQSSCHEKLLEKDDLSLLGRMGQKEVNKLNNKGIFTVYQFSYTFRSKRPKKKPILQQRVNFSLKALALREKRTYIIEIPTLPVSPIEIYFDVEGLSEEGFIYLIGILVIEGGIENQYSFWADTQEDIEEILTSFINLVSNLEDFTIYHYGSYDTLALKKINKALDNRFDKEIELITKRSKNILSFFSSHIYPPTYTNSLKDIAIYIGFEWADEKASGLQSVVWRKNWELTDDIKYKEKIIQYNASDCKALYLIKIWITSIEDKLTNGENVTFSRTAELQNLNYKKWGKANFQIPEFEEVNNFAYFDYQRNKVYLRTNKKVKRALRRAKKYRQHVNEIDKKIKSLPIKCPNCSHNNFYRLNDTKKIVINLKFMTNGVKKWIVRLPSSSFHKYGRNLIIWSMNQYIKYLPSMPKIGEILLENFNIYVPEGDLYEFKPNLAKEYQSSYEEIKQILIDGSLIHADETKIAVTGNPDGYVWVFTSMDTVYYEYRPNREAEFLKELLTNFQGVLISDFYPGYDFLPCQQQKCLIHLIRDLNNDLLINQLNTEYKNIVIRFGILLRKIIKTVDTFGLRKRHLQKHKREVDNFYSQLLITNYETELTIGWQKRFRKNKGKLFNFLNYDDIPWNNNNAEHAVKPFAKFRARCKGMLRQEGIKDFLVLLSIEQTCRYRGINFLDFLRSKEKSIEGYSFRRR